MEILKNIFAYLSELNTVSIIIRLVLAILLGGIIGMERERKHRPAGFRTYMLVCLGAALTVLVSQYLVKIGYTTDVSRLGAQVISGVGFLGAGTIIVTSRRQVKGLTTAAGLWASACMGLAIGAGFYGAAIFSCILIRAAFSLLNRLNAFIMSKARNMTVYIEYSSADCLGTIIDKVKDLKVRITDIELSNSQKDNGEKVFGVILSLETQQKIVHTEIITNIATIENVRSVEEL